MTFDDFFHHCTGFGRHDWQARLAAEKTCQDRLIRIPTGFGKTAGVTLAWLYHRVALKNPTWPRRLVLCLPMRTLVEQTEKAVSSWLEKSGLNPRPCLHVLMGGLAHSEWHLEPEREAVLIGTQDMLLSRALNRGYGSGRARWPMEFSLLNLDCLWVLDEIQLMGVGLATTAQLQAFAEKDQQAGCLPRPRRTWWMSATLQRGWLRRAPDLTGVERLPIETLQPSEKAGPLWDVTKTLQLKHLPAVQDPKATQWADLVLEAHSRTDRGITLTVVNTVKSALALHDCLEKKKRHGEVSADVNLPLVHSRFRGEERRTWAKDFLAREKCGAGANRIIVATQVVEAGVDISADALITELAPWASLVQRFGRCARYGGKGEVVVVDRRHTDETAQSIAAKTDDERRRKREDEDAKRALPYSLDEIESAAEAVSMLTGADPAELERIEEERKDLLPRLYPYRPLHVLTRRELRDLFDTGPDLTGADVDISRFVREGDERDVSVWWWPIPEDEKLPPKRLRPAHNALCRISIGDAASWLTRGGGSKRDDEAPAFDPSPELTGKKTRPRAWVWSYVEGSWVPLEHNVHPGQTILVNAGAGGYDPKVGFAEKSAARVDVKSEHARGVDAADAADAADEQDELSEGVGESKRQYKTIATHNAEVAVKAREVAACFGLDAETTALLELAGLAHDIGKAHPAFAGAVRDRNGIAPELPLAKAPKGRWHHIRHMYDHGGVGKRPAFRHELASALALFELAWRARPEHPALHGGREELLDATVGRELPDAKDRILDPQGLLVDLLALDATMFDLVAYLVMCHHGKVRATLPMSARDQQNPGPSGDLPIRGVREGDVIPELVLAHGRHGDFVLPQVSLNLEPAKLGLSKRYGPSWVERVLGLRERFGDFQLVWLETLLRVADVRASCIDQPLDPRLPAHLAQVVATPPGNDPAAELLEWVERTLAAAAAALPSQQPLERTRDRAVNSGLRAKTSKRTTRTRRGGAA